MADYEATTRSNYFHVTDEKKFHQIFEQIKKRILELSCSPVQTTLMDSVAILMLTWTISLNFRILSRMMTA